MSKLIVHQFEEFERQEPLREDYLISRSQHVYQGPSHHDSMDNLRHDFRRTTFWQRLKDQWVSSLLFAVFCVQAWLSLKDWRYWLACATVIAFGVALRMETSNE